jgi:hypothetical protein
MTLLNFDTQIMKIYFNFFHISVDFRFKKGQTTSLVQKPYFVALSGRAFSSSFQSSHHTVRAHFYSGNFMYWLFVNT